MSTMCLLFEPQRRRPAAACAWFHASRRCASSGRTPRPATACDRRRRPRAGAAPCGRRGALDSQDLADADQPRGNERAFFAGEDAGDDVGRRFQGRRDRAALSCAASVEVEKGRQRRPRRGLAGARRPGARRICGSRRALRTRRAPNSWCRDRCRRAVVHRATVAGVRLSRSRIFSSSFQRAGRLADAAARRRTTARACRPR